MEFIHGFFSGIGQSIISHPLDTYKTWLQVQRKETITIKGLYRGFMYPTLFNSLITGLAFKAYEYGKENDTKYNKIYGGIYAGIVTGLLSSWVEYKKIGMQLLCSDKLKFNKECIITLLIREIPACVCYYPIYDILKEKNYNTILSGGIAGVTCWTSSYWADVLNTHVISGSSIKDVIKKLHFSDYFRGISICIPRAFIVNACGYYFYEISKTYIN
jgi:solute carrier family 25 carnitine/acylcarnitine transporter 20/29